MERKMDTFLSICCSISHRNPWEIRWMSLILAWGECSGREPRTFEPARPSQQPLPHPPVVFKVGPMQLNHIWFRGILRTRRHLKYFFTFPRLFLSGHMLAVRQRARLAGGGLYHSDVLFCRGRWFVSSGIYINAWFQAPWQGGRFYWF